MIHINYQYWSVLSRCTFELVFVAEEVEEALRRVDLLRHVCNQGCVSGSECFGKIQIPILQNIGSEIRSVSQQKNFCYIGSNSELFFETWIRIRNRNRLFYGRIRNRSLLRVGSGTSHSWRSDPGLDDLEGSHPGFFLWFGSPSGSEPCNHWLQIYFQEVSSVKCLFHPLIPSFFLKTDPELCFFFTLI